MASIPEVIERWIRTLHGDERSNLNGTNVIGAGRALYSYGTHFPLCEYLPADRRRPRPLYLLNGDRSTVSTSRHQRETQSAVARAVRTYGGESIIVPFSALEAAGIRRDSIVPLEVRPDEWITVASVPCPVDLRDLESADERVQTCEPFYSREGHGTREIVEYRWRANGYRFYRCGVPGEEPRQPYCDEWPAGEPRELSADWTRLETRRHRLGDSLFVADVPMRVNRRRPATVREVVLNASRGDRLEWVDDDGYVREPVSVMRRRRFVSSFDTNEPAPLYFLATLPRSSRATTVDGAIMDLAPAAVHAAVLRGRHVERQGDIFAVETSLTDADMQGWPRARLTQWTRGARARKGESGYVAPLSADERRRQVRRARALWRARWSTMAPAAGPSTTRDTRKTMARQVSIALRSLETNRRHARRTIIGPAPTMHPNYRNANPNLARGHAAARARDAVAYARRDLRNAYARRGFVRDEYRTLSAIRPGTRALSLWRDCMTDALYGIRPALRPARQDRARRDLRELLSVYGTAHTATEVARGPGGRVYLRGVMRHEPSLEPGRRGGRDHVNRPLRDGVWYLAVRNTVPRQRSDRRAR